MRRLDIRSRNNVTNDVKDNMPHNSKGFGPRHKGKNKDKQNNNNGIQCHDCEGFEYIQVECTNFLRRQNKGYTTIFFSDDESNK